MSKNKYDEDVICDIDADLEVLQKKAEFIERDGQLIRVDRFGVMRDDKGRFVSGTINGKSAKKAYKLDEILENKFGEDLNEVFEKIKQIALYDPDKPEIVYDDKGQPKLKKKNWHFYNANTQMQALTLMVKYYYGNPRKEIQIDQTVDIKIEKKVADLTKLINENRLQIENKGKEEDD